MFKEINFCVDLLRKTKTECFKNLNIKYLSDNRKFRKTIKLYFSNKVLNSNKLLLKKKGNLVYLSDNRNVWKTIKPYFSNKGLNSNKFLLKEKGNLVSYKKELATTMNDFCNNITKD